MTVIACTLSGNSSAGDGSGIWNHGTLTVSGSTLSDNSATQGGGIYNIFETLTVNDSTVCGNNASLGADLFLAGGVLIDQQQQHHLRHLPLTISPRAGRLPAVDAIPADERGGSG